MKPITQIVIDNANGIFIRAPYRSGRFYIDNEVVNDGYLKFLGKKWLVYTVLSRRAHHDAQGCFLSYKTLIAETGIKSRNFISGSIKTLIKLNMITTRKVAGIKSSVYYLLDYSQWKPVTSINVDTNKSVSKRVPKQYQKQQNTSIGIDTQSELIKSTKEVKESKNGVPEEISRQIKEILRNSKMPKID